MAATKDTLSTTAYPVCCCKPNDKNCSHHIPYILESNAHLFYSFRGLKNQMRIRFTVESWILEKWYSHCTCRKNNAIQSFIILFITVGARGGRSVNATMNVPIPLPSFSVSIPTTSNISVIWRNHCVQYNKIVTFCVIHTLCIGNEISCNLN
jgi:hypothetical protein